MAVLLREVPDLREIRMILRAAGDEAAQERLRDEVLPSEAFEGVREVAEAAFADGFLRAVAGDFTAERLGREDDEGLAGIDVAVHCAASVSFEEPLDEILDLNVLGALRLTRALREANRSSEPAFVHVSTAYAAGMRTGLVLERRLRRGPGGAGRGSGRRARRGARLASRPRGRVAAARPSGIGSPARPRRNWARRGRFPWPAELRSCAAIGSPPSSSRGDGGAAARSAGPTATRCPRRWPSAQ